MQTQDTRKLKKSQNFNNVKSQKHALNYRPMQNELFPTALINFFGNYCHYRTVMRSIDQSEQREQFNLYFPMKMYSLVDAASAGHSR